MRLKIGKGKRQNSLITFIDAVNKLNSMINKSNSTQVFIPVQSRSITSNTRSAISNTDFPSTSKKKETTSRKTGKNIIYSLT